MIDVNLLQKINLAYRYPHTAKDILLDPYLYKNKPTPFPRLINCFITEICNFRCQMCHVDQSRMARLKYLDFEYMKKIIDEAAPFHPSFQIAGGEPLLYPDIVKTLWYLSKRQIPTGMVSNGFYLESFAKDLINSELDFLAISLDGPNKETQKKRGLVDSFDQIIAGIKKFIELRGNKPFPNLRLATVITRDNLENFDQILSIAEQLRVNQWSLSHHFYFNDKIKKAQESFAKREKMGPDVWGEYIGGRREFFDKDERNRLKDKFKRILEKKHNDTSQVRISLDETSDIDKYYTSMFPSQKSVCTSPYRQIFIRGDGDMEMCQGYIIGNAKKDRIYDSWHNAKATHFRQAYKRCGTMPACFRCCSLDIKFD